MTQTTPLKAKVDRLFAPWNKKNTPGCALAVVQDGQIIYKRGYGIANLEYGVPITPSTIFHIASVSKHVTTMAVILLAHEGKLTLDDDVRRHLPELPDFGHTITLRHLMHHTSGLRDQWDLLILAGWRMEDVITEDDIFTLVQHQKDLNFPPGSDHLYCNTGYTLLGMVIKRVTGQSLREYTDAALFQPLGMTHTHFHDDHRYLVPDRAYSYRPRGDGYEHSLLAYANAGATSLFTTVEDLALWDRNFNDLRVGGDAVFADLHTRGKLNNDKELDYASGLAIGEYRGLKMVFHGGGDAGYRTHFLRFPDQRFTVILFSNLASFDAGGMARKVADLFLADQLAPLPPRPRRRAMRKIDPALYDNYLGEYQLFPGFWLTITREGDRLFLQAGKQEKQELFPESTTTFFQKTADARVTFPSATEGPAPTLTLHQYGQDMPAQRVQRAVLTPARRKAYVGDYYSDELDVTYRIRLREDQLFLRHKKGEVVLMPLVDDQFGSDLATVTFTRDARGHIDGFTVGTGRVKNLRFCKTSGNTRC